MRLSIGAGIGPFRVSQTIARTRGSGRRPNAVGMMIQAVLLAVIYVTMWSVKLSVRVSVVLLGCVVRTVKRHRSTS